MPTAIGEDVIAAAVSRMVGKCRPSHAHHGKDDPNADCNPDDEIAMDRHSRANIVLHGSASLTWIRMEHPRLVSTEHCR